MCVNIEIITQPCLPTGYLEIAYRIGMDSVGCLELTGGNCILFGECAGHKPRIMCSRTSRGA